MKLFSVNSSQRARPTRTAVAAAAAAAAAGLLGAILSPAQAAAPDLAALSSQAFAGSSSPLDELGRPTPATAQRVRAFASQPWIPQDVRNAILSGLAFATGQGEAGGPPLPEGGPAFRQFYWPTVSAKCIGGQGDSVGSAIAVPGPSQIPAPGAGAGEAVFLFTALGTAPAATQQGGMRVRWFNLDTLQAGITALENNSINVDGPTTVSGRAATGRGTIIALLEGTVNTQEAACTFAPTAAFLQVR